jgi:lipoprotein NlpI
MVRRTASHAARGVLYAEAGLLDEAEMEFQTHLNLRPADERVKGLLRIVKSWRSEESYLPPSPTTTKPAQ